MSQLLEPQQSERPETPSVSNRSRIDVSDLPADDVAEFVRTNVDTDHVSLEHRGSRTYLLVETASR